MRAIGVTAAILTLGSCGAASGTEVRYDVKAATDCIRHAQPAETGRSHPFEDTRGFWIAFGDDHFAYLSYTLVVGYGPDRATASANEPVLKPRFHRHRVWGRHDGNVVYDTFGPVEVSSLRTRPPGLTVRQIRRWAAISSERMRLEVQRCLAKARRGTRRSPNTENPPAPAAS